MPDNYKKQTQITDVFMKNLILTALFLTCTFSFGQSLKDKLSKIETIEEANDFVYENAENNVEFIKINSEDAKSETDLKLLKNTSKELITINKNIYKMIATDKEDSFRASYIYFDGKKKTLKEINTAREKVIEAYRRGISFQELSKEHTMDPNQNTDMGWFVAGETIPEFENAIKAHKKGEIFTVDSPQKHWYYVVLKTHDNTLITTKSFIRISK